jgi:hypothetical protein
MSSRLSPGGPSGGLSSAAIEQPPGAVTMYRKHDANPRASACAADFALRLIQVTTPGASYTGLAINQAQTQLYAANNAGSGSINVFNSSFAQVGTIATPAAISALNLVPFNVQSLSNGNVAVTYAPAGGRASQIGATQGMGAVAIFTESGTLLRTMVGGPSPHHGALRSPRPISVRSRTTCWSAVSRCCGTTDQITAIKA